MWPLDPHNASKNTNDDLGDAAGATKYPDPFLIAQLHCVNLQLRALFSIATQACANGSYEAAERALATCSRNLEEILEATHLYLPLSRGDAGGSDTSAEIAQIHTQTNELAGRFLRLSRTLIRACRTKQTVAPAFKAAAGLLDSYVIEQELQLFRAYALIARTGKAA